MIKAIYLNDWADNQRYAWSSGGLEGLKEDFVLKDSDLEGVEILFASYDNVGYSGSAFVLFRKDGKFYEVNGSHCSCYGLEGQWEPEEVTLKALNARLTGEYFGENEFDVELKDLMNKLLIRYGEFKF